jgi:hypothetical protein
MVQAETNHGKKNQPELKATYFGFKHKKIWKNIFNTRSFISFISAFQGPGFWGHWTIFSYVDKMLQT